MHGNENYNNKNYKEALSNYQNAKQYKSEDTNLEAKIKETETEIKKQEEAQRKADEIARKKAEANKPSVNRVSILSKGFGHNEYGEEAVLGKIKNNNKQTAWIRADIDLYDEFGNKTGYTYTYDKIAPGQIWNFSAPTFDVYATNMKIHLTVDPE